MAKFLFLCRKEQGYVHVLQSHKEVMQGEHAEHGRVLTLRDFVKMVKRPLPIHVAVNPVPKHLYAVSTEEEE